MNTIEPLRAPVPLLAVAAAILSVALLPTVAQAQDDQVEDGAMAAGSEEAVLIGKVVSRTDGRPVEGASVRVRGTPLRATAVTDALGRYRLSGLPAGTHVLEVKELGKETRLLPVVLRRGHDTHVTVRVAPDAVVMDEIEVTVNRGWQLEEAGFWDRLEVGMGTYLAPADIERRDASRTADLLSTMPGLEVGPARQGSRSLRIGRSAGNRACDPVLYVNGRMTISQKVDDVHASDVLAVEVYRGAASLPARFHRNRGRSDCGAIVIWTKLRER